MSSAPHVPATMPPAVNSALLAIDAAREADAIAASIREQVLGVLHRRGAIVAMSGGVDSSVVAALCAKALGPSAVLGLSLPERDTPADARRLGRDLAARLEIRLVEEDITAALDGFGCQRRQLEAIRSVFPDYGEGWRCKLALPSILEGERLAVFQLVVESPSGERFTSRLSAPAYRQLVAATDFKQRTRKAFEYYHADRLGYAVVGTPNRLEHDEGFFVKQGDGDADLKPIAHLYKTQVYALAEHLGIPREIRERPPSTETFSLPQTQEEFFFSVPLAVLDVCLFGKTHGIAAALIAKETRLSPAQVERVYRDIETRRRATEYLRTPPLYARAVEA